MNELKTYPNCNNLLEFDLRLKKIVCKSCGWSENKNGDKKEIPDYVG